MENNVNKILFFDKLKQKRKDNKLTVEDVVEGIKINKSYVEAIENGDFHILPKTYIRLFLKSYAKFIGENDKKILDEYKNFITGINHIKNKTPSFIKEKKVLTDVSSNRYNDKTNIPFNKIIFAVLIIIAFILSYFIFDSLYFKEHKINISLNDWSSDKLNWENDFKNIDFFDSETIQLNINSKNNQLIYKTSIYPDKIIITDSEGKNISNRILDKNDSDQNSFSGNIRFALLNGSGSLQINEQRIVLKNKGVKVTGKIKKDILTLNYYK